MDEQRVLHLSQVFCLKETKAHRKTQPVEDTVVELYQTLRPSLVRYVYQLVGSTRDAEDLVQVAFLKLFDQLNGRAKILNLRSWLYRVVHNLVIDHVRRQSKHESVTNDWVSTRSIVAVPISPEGELIQREQIEMSLSILNERERHCLLLRAEGLSYKEISEVLGISAKAVSVYLARGLKKFEEKDEERS